MLFINNNGICLEIFSQLYRTFYYESKSINKKSEFYKY